MGSGTTSSTTRSSTRSCAVMRSAVAAFSRISWLLPSFQRIAAQPSTVITEYTAFSSISTRSATPSASAPPDPPSPITVAMIGTVSWLISRRFRAIASDCPRSHGVDESDHGDVEFFGELHQAQGLSVTLRMWHAEVALEQLFRVAPALLPHDHDR